MTLKEYMTVAEASEKLKCTPEHVALLSRQWKLPGAEKKGRDWFIPIKAIEGYALQGKGGNAVKGWQTRRARKEAEANALKEEINQAIAANKKK